MIPVHILKSFQFQVEEAGKLLTCAVATAHLAIRQCMGAIENLRMLQTALDRTLAVELRRQKEELDLSEVPSVQGGTLVKLED